MNISKHLLNINMTAVRDLFSVSFFFHLFVYFRCSERIKTNEEKKKENAIVCAVEANDLVTSE